MNARYGLFEDFCLAAAIGAIKHPIDAIIDAGGVLLQMALGKKLDRAFSYAAMDFPLDHEY